MPNPNETEQGRKLRELMRFPSVQEHVKVEVLAIADQFDEMAAALARYANHKCWSCVDGCEEPDEDNCHVTLWNQPESRGYDYAESILSALKARTTRSPSDG